MNGKLGTQLQLDFRTGQSTFIHGERLSTRARQDCSSLNRLRARGIQETARQIASWEQVPLDVWTSLVVGAAHKFEVPLIPLDTLGIDFDDLGFMRSSFLERLGTGAEASAWMDRKYRCVYKLFDLKSNGALGKKIRLVPEGPYECRVVNEDAVLADTLEKLALLHEVGACTTEIVGLADTGDYLIVKQPLCQPYRESAFESDRDEAVKTIQAVIPTGSYGPRVWVFWGFGRAWILGDLHKGNIMRTAEGLPTIIDALVGPLDQRILQSVDTLQRAANRARALRLGKAVETDDLLFGISDDEL